MLNESTPESSASASNERPKIEDMPYEFDSCDVDDGVDGGPIPKGEGMGA